MVVVVTAGIGFLPSYKIAAVSKIGPSNSACV